MGIRFFGHFLLERGVVDREQLLAATELQEKRNHPLGAIAVQKGFITADQAEHVNRQQRVAGRRFGDLCVDMNLLSHMQLDEISRTQREGRIRIGEALVELGHMDAATVETEIAAFELDQAPFKSVAVELPEDTPEPDFVQASIGLTEKLLLRVAHLRAKRGPVESIDGGESAATLLSVRIAFSEDVKAVYAISMPRNIAQGLATRLLGDEIAITEPIISDALSEFCNIVCGNICGKMGHSDRNVAIGVPSPGLPPASDTASGVRVPFHLPDCVVEMRLYF
jgi:CheY-specific phosphatase CheX